MARSFSVALLIVAGVFAAAPAQAQLPNIFDTLFGGGPPRPPAEVPRSNLPPPPGAASAPAPMRAPLDTRMPQDAQMPVAPGPTQPGQPPSIPASAPPNDEIVVEPPAVKIPNPTAVFSGLDKITGRITAFEVAMNETVRFGALEVTPRACFTRPPTETANTDGFVEVDELTLQGELRRIFTGWMYAASPGLNAVEHPIYDVWLTDCKGGDQAPVADVAPETPAAATRPQPRRPAPPPRRATAPAQPLPGPPPAR